MAYYGPFSETLTFNNPKLQIIRSRYRQKAPYIDRLPYLFSREEALRIANPWGMSSDNLPGISASSISFPSAYSKAYGKFVEQARSSVNLAVNIAERKQAIDMIASRCMQMYRFSRQLSSFRFAAAAKTLGLRVVSQSKRRNKYVQRVIDRQGREHEVRLTRSAKAFGNNYLEYHFGWENIVKDVGDGVELIHDSPFPKLGRRIKASATEFETQPKKPTVSRWSSGLISWWPKKTAKLMGTVVIEDPNIARLNQLGFVNPAVILWELIPFSFVVDWFSNVGQVLSSYTDFAGFSLQNSSVTYFGSHQTISYQNGGYPNYSAPPFVTLAVHGQRGLYVKRSLGVPLPTVTLKPVKWPSVTRGLTSVSLLAQFLRNR